MYLPTFQKLAHELIFKRVTRLSGLAIPAGLWRKLSSHLPDLRSPI